jgi:hypothetical protein
MRFSCSNAWFAEDLFANNRIAYTAARSKITSSDKMIQRMNNSTGPIFGLILILLRNTSACFRQRNQSGLFHSKNLLELKDRTDFKGDGEGCGIAVSF